MYRPGQRKIKLISDKNAYKQYSNSCVLVKYGITGCYDIIER